MPFHLAGCSCLFANDINHDANSTFSRNISPNISSDDIRNIDPLSVVDQKVDIVIGGFPCQDFSVTWKRPGLNGERGGLYWHFKRFVEALNPLVFVAENVKGLLSANGGIAIKTIVKDFSDAKPGYYIYPKLYNFANYGAPQLRERVIIVGVRSDITKPFFHPKPTHGEGLLPYVTAGKALSYICPDAPNNEHLKITPKTARIIGKISAGGNFSDIPEDDPDYVKGMISHIYRRIDPNKPAMTLIASGGGGTWGYHFPEPRPLTNRERARLQSFPDSFVFSGSTTEVRRQIGNAVPPEGAAFIAEQVLNFLKTLYEWPCESMDPSAVSLSCQKQAGIWKSKTKKPKRDEQLYLELV